MDPVGDDHQVELALGALAARVDRDGDTVGGLAQPGAEREPMFGELGRMFYVQGAPAGERTALGRLTASIEAWFDEVLAVGRAAGAVRTDLPAGLQAQVAIAVLRAFDAWSVRHRAEFGRDEARRLVRAQLDALRRLLAPAS